MIAAFKDSARSLLLASLSRPGCSERGFASSSAFYRNRAASLNGTVAPSKKVPTIIYPKPKASQSIVQENTPLKKSPLKQTTPESKTSTQKDGKSEISKEAQSTVYRVMNVATGNEAKHLRLTKEAWTAKDLPSFKKTIVELCKDSNEVGAKRAMDRLTALGHLPDEECVVAFLEMYKREGRIDDMFSFIKQMQRRSVRMGNSTLEILLDYISKFQDFQLIRMMQRFIDIAPPSFPRSLISKALETFPYSCRTVAYCFALRKADKIKHLLPQIDVEARQETEGFSIITEPLLRMRAKGSFGVSEAVLNNENEAAVGITWNDGDCVACSIGKVKSLQEARLIAFSMLLALSHPSMLEAACGSMFAIEVSNAMMKARAKSRRKLTDEQLQQLIEPLLQRLPNKVLIEDLLGLLRQFSSRLKTEHNEGAISTDQNFKDLHQFAVQLANQELKNPSESFYARFQRQ